MDIILASKSPRRKELLTRMGVEDFRTLSPDVDERELDGLPPEELVRRLSAWKAQAVEERVGKGAVIIAADTVVVLDGTVLGKPADELEAFKMLTTLSGMRHQVHTGVTVLFGDQTITGHEVTDVTFRDLSAEEIADYVATKEPLDKAGAYGIQGYGALLIERIEGDYYNVMGLPVCRLGKMLAQVGINCLHLAAER